MAELWEKQENETVRAYRYFCIYRDLGPDRSLAKLRKLLQEQGKRVSKTRLEVLCSKHNWVKRAEAYDQYLDQQQRLQHEQLLKEMAERHARMAVAFQQKIAERLKTLKPEDLSPSDLAKWFDVAVKLERLSRGEPTEIGKEEVVLPAVVEVQLPKE